MILCFVVIATVIDVSENLDRFLDSSAPFWDILTRYYINFCIFFGNLLSPYIVFLTIIWFTSRMAQRSEIVPILSSGVTFSRLLQPYLVTSVFLIGAGLLLSHYLIPLANQVKYGFEEEYLLGHVQYEHDVHRELKQDTIYFFHSLYDVKSRCSQFTIEYWDEGRMKKQLISAKAEYFEDTDLWKMKLVEYYSYHEDGTMTFSQKAEIDTALNVKFEDFGNRPEIIWNMNTPDLNEYIEQERDKGAGNIANFEIEKHTRTSNPFSMLVLTIIGFSISTRKVRGGTGIHLLFGLILGALFVFSSRITTVSAMNMGFAPVVAVWIPNFLFLGLALIFYRRAPK